MNHIDNPRIEVLRFSKAHKIIEPCSFYASAALFQPEGGNKSAITLPDGTRVTLLLSYQRLMEKISEGMSPLDLKQDCEIIVPAPEPKKGQKMDDGTFYLGRFKNRDGTERDWFAAAEDAMDKSGRRLLLNFNDAAVYARNAKAHGHDDWMLPSAGDSKEPNILNEVFNNKAGLNIADDASGKFPAGWYWSSTPAEGNDGYCQNLKDGDQDHIYRTNALAVRLVRSVTV